MAFAVSRIDRVNLTPPGARACVNRVNLSYLGSDAQKPGNAGVNRVNLSPIGHLRADASSRGNRVNLSFPSGSARGLPNTRAGLNRLNLSPGLES